MSKIGVITYSFTVDNYGQVLQYLATQKYLQSLGYEAFLVDAKGWKRFSKGWIVSKFYGLKKRVLTFLFKSLKKRTQTKESENKKITIFDEWASATKRQERKHPRHFNDFKKQFFCMQSDYYNGILKSDYDAFCVGSDQTWSSCDQHWFLNWVPKRIKKFSIAPSVGHHVFSDLEIKICRQSLRRFDFITVRENNGLDFCKRCEIYDAKKILDPTFLLTQKEYNAYVKEELSKPYVLVYLLGGEISISVQEIVAFCESKGLDIKYVESQGRVENIKEKCYATVGEWIGLIKNASYVITNSFHGMAFSIIYRKPFLVLPLINMMEGMNGRIFDLAENMQLQTRIYKNDLEQIFAPIDWTCAEQKIAENKLLLDGMVKSLNL